MSNDNYFDTNKAFWNESVPVHLKSELYDVDNFRKGVNKLNPLERQELGDVSGKTILHLQCHFGVDSLSLEMLGATVTGVDYSEEGIKTAISLRNELGMKSEFILSDVYSLPEKLNKKFDIVYCSYGVLIWLPDLDKWAQVISHFLKDTGFFYIAEVHPCSVIFDNADEDEKLSLKYAYFKKPEPLLYEGEGTYADVNARLKNNITYEWTHSLSDIIMSLINAGLKIEFFHEHNFTVWKQFPWMKKDKDGYFRIENDIPLLFSLKAIKNQ